MDKSDPGQIAMFSNELVSKALQSDQSPTLVNDQNWAICPPIRFKGAKLRRQPSPAAFLRVAPQTSSPGRIATLLFTPSRERHLGRPRLELHRRSMKISTPPLQIRLTRHPSPPRPCPPLRLSEQDSGFIPGKADSVSPMHVESRRFRSPSGALPVCRPGRRMHLASVHR